MLLRINSTVRGKPKQTAARLQMSLSILFKARGSDGCTHAIAMIIFKYGLYVFLSVSLSTRSRLEDTMAAVLT